jgi:hypothetical protein
MAGRCFWTRSVICRWRAGEAAACPGNGEFQRWFQPYAQGPRTAWSVPPCQSAALIAAGRSARISTTGECDRNWSALAGGPPEDIQVWPSTFSAVNTASPRKRGSPRAARMAGECARVAQCHRAGKAACTGRQHPGRRPGLPESQARGRNVDEPDRDTLRRRCAKRMET